MSEATTQSTPSETTQTTTTAPADAAPAVAPAVPAADASVAAPADPAPAADAAKLIEDTMLAEKGGEGEAGDEKPEEAAAAVPEAYELTAPEGFAIRPEALELATPVFKELGLTNEQADKLMPVAAQFAEQVRQGLVDESAATTAQWATDSRADPELGNGDTAAFTQNLGIAAKALDDFGGGEFRQFLSDTGLGNHPEMIRFCLRVGKAVSDEARVFRTDSSATPAKLDPLAINYPNNLPQS